MNAWHQATHHCQSLRARVVLKDNASGLQIPVPTHALGRWDCAFPPLPAPNLPLYQDVTASPHHPFPLGPVG